MRPRLIAFLSDYGVQDPYVGIVHAVIHSLSRGDVRVIDLSHGIPSFSIRAGAYVLYSSYKYFPPGTVFLVVVDPGVGGPRRGITIKTRNYVFVGPDNGVMWPASHDDGIVEVREIANEDLFIKPVSHTFHGRDIFAPVATKIALGLSLACVGPLLDVSQITKLSLVEVKRVNSCYKLTVNYVDKFGNIALSALGDLYDEVCRGYTQVRVRGRGGTLTAHCVRSFSHVKPGQAALYVNSLGFLEVAVYMGSASQALGVRVGDEVMLCPATE